MPEMTTFISVSEVARRIRAMNRQEIETLTELLTEDGTEFLERKKDIELGRVKTLTREEVFDV